MMIPSQLKRVGLLLGFIVAMFFFGSVFQAQVVDDRNFPSFDSQSDGSDGRLVITSPSPDPKGYLFDPMDPSTFDPDGNNGKAVLDQDGDGVYHFTEIQIGEGVTVRLKEIPLNTKPVVWLVTGPVVIDGLLDLGGDPGHGSGQLPRHPAVAGAGGYSGGIGGSPFNPVGEAGYGPGGGAPDTFTTFTAGGGGHSEPGNGSPNLSEDGTRIGGFTYGNRFLLPLFGGSGSGGGTGDTSSGGGAGGGAIMIASSESIALDGTIDVQGGVHSASQGRGFHGSGGSIRLRAPTILGAGSLLAIGPATSTGFPAAGRIRIETSQNDFRGTSQPLPSVSSIPGFLFTPPRSIRVVRVSSAEVPMNPIGDFQQPDVVIDESGEVTIEIEAQGIPIGAMVQLKMFSDDGPTHLAVSSPLVGDLQLSTTTVSIQVPPGLSRFSVMARWDSEE